MEDCTLEILCDVRIAQVFAVIECISLPACATLTFLTQVL